MRGIISSDWQTEYSNHDECVIAWEFILRLCKKYSLEAIVLGGDLKSQYNPIDVRVIKFWQKAIEKAIAKNIRVIILLGNHDRLGLYTDKKNWFSILRKAGAETFDSPGVCELTNGKIAMLPFTTSTKELRKRSDYLASLDWNRNTDILLFHADIKNCKYNQYGTISSGRLRYKELHPEKYLACIGGHIHLPQDIESNGYYVGPPFTMDWGEVNQKKRFLLVLDHEIKSIDSPLPGWYDETVSGYIKPKSWKDTRVRIHVDVESKTNYKKQLEKAKLFAERDHPGAIIKVVPEFSQEENKQAKILINDSDKQKITTFVKETISSKLKNKEKQIINFLTAKLQEVDKSRRHANQSIKFIDFEGTNFLSFKKIKIIFEKQRLVVIEGTNKDWNNQSNASGKTSYVQSIPVSLFGATFKKQTHDRWARRQTKSKAIARLRFSDGNKIYTVIRQRHPNKLQLLAGNNDHSIGLNKKLETGTQGRIESIIGLTLQTLANAVYIDKSVAYSFIAGTKSDRAQLLYRFQNLERFTKALIVVKKYKQNHQTTIEQNQKAIDTIETKIEETKSNLDNVEKDSSSRIKTIRHTYIKQLREWKKLHTKKLKAERLTKKVCRKYQKKYDEAALVVVAYEKQIDTVKRSLWDVDREIQRLKQLLDKSKCPTCEAKIDVRKFKPKFKLNIKTFQNIKQSINELTKKKNKANEKCALYEGEIARVTLEENQIKDKANNLRNNLRWMKSQIAELKSKENKSIDKVKAYLKKLKIDFAGFKEYRHQLDKDNRFIDYCEHAFSKDGLPAFINAQTAPILNKAAEYYSELFCDKEVMVQFDADEGDLVPRIVNLHGGDKVIDQSNGEASIAGLITSFALKEIAPKTNVLVLDEPEAGLSPENIKRFAKVITKIKDRFETIFIVTHNPFLLSAIQPDKRIRIVKQNSISKSV